jgi:hypothetical protein
VDTALWKLRWQSNIAAVLNQRKEHFREQKDLYLDGQSNARVKQRKTLEAHCWAVLQCLSAQVVGQPAATSKNLVDKTLSLQRLDSYCHGFSKRNARQLSSRIFKRKLY